MKKFVVKFA